MGKIFLEYFFGHYLFNKYITFSTAQCLERNVWPLYQRAPPGSSVALYCQSSSVPTWIHEGYGHYFMTHVIIIPIVTVYTEGIYKCLGADEYNQPFTSSSILVLDGKMISV